MLVLVRPPVVVSLTNEHGASFQLTVSPLPGGLQWSAQCSRQSRILSTTQQYTTLHEAPLPLPEPVSSLLRHNDHARVKILEENCVTEGLAKLCRESYP